MEALGRIKRFAMILNILKLAEGKTINEKHFNY